MASIIFLWRRISVKARQLMAVPEDLIADLIHREANKFHLFLLHFKSFYKEPFFKDFLRNSASKVFYRIHILLMKMDNGVVNVLRKVRVNGNGNGGVGANGKYPLAEEENFMFVTAQERPGAHVMQSQMGRRNGTITAVSEKDKKIHSYFSKSNRVTEVRISSPLHVTHIKPIERTLASEPQKKSSVRRHSAKRTPKEESISQPQHWA